MVNGKNFAKRLEKILDFYGLSATAFSDKIDFNRSTISHLISGRNKPSLEFVLKVVEAFDEVDLYWLLLGKGTFPSTPNSQQNEIVEISTQTESRQDNVELEKDPILETPQSKQKMISGDASSTIERIVIFYKDGSFKEYLP